MGDAKTLVSISGCGCDTLKTGQGGRLHCGCGGPRTIPRMAGGEGAKMALDHMP
jgi:hypothetical protein